MATVVGDDRYERSVAHRAQSLEVRSSCPLPEVVRGEIFPAAARDGQLGLDPDLKMRHVNNPGCRWNWFMRW